MKTRLHIQRITAAPLERVILYAVLEEHWRPLREMFCRDVYVCLEQYYHIGISNWGFSFGAVLDNTQIMIILSEVD